MLGLRRPPAGSRPKLSRDERVIAWAPVAPSTSADEPGPPGAVVVTTLGLWLPGRERLGWHQIHKATWSGTRLTVIPAHEVGEGAGYTVMVDDEPLVVELSRPGNVPAEVRSRVTRSVAQTEHVEVPGGGARVVARRVPGANGLIWHVRYDDGTDATAPEVVATTDEVVAELSAPQPD